MHNLLHHQYPLGGSCKALASGLLRALMRVTNGFGLQGWWTFSVQMGTVRQTRIAGYPSPGSSSQNRTELWQLSNLLQAPLEFGFLWVSFPSCYLHRNWHKLGRQKFCQPRSNNLSASLWGQAISLLLLPLPGNPGPRELLPSTISVASDVAVGWPGPWSGCVEAGRLKRPGQPGWSKQQQVYLWRAAAPCLRECALRIFSITLHRQKQITQVSLLAVLLSGGFLRADSLQTLFTKDYTKLIKTSSSSAWQP